MKYETYGIIAAVLVIAVAGMVTFDGGVSGGVVINGPVCCSVTPYTQASYGVAQYGTVTETVVCNNMQPHVCCMDKMTAQLRLPVVVNGAMVGACGQSSPELNLPYMLPY
ncbi:hypothetical protein KY329_01105 [Candidatus Woesearchaeota archaeon]|nr:hypothetical protein [Candidatus Woesearchaeota archaeon]